MSTYRQLFNEDFRDIVRKKTKLTKSEPLSYYEKMVRMINIKLNRHLPISDFECWMFCKLAYSNEGIHQEFINKKHNQRFMIKDFISKSDGLQLYVIESRLTKDIIVSFRGTDEWVDWLTNIQILRGKKRQFDSARNYLSQLFKEHPGYDIYLCGHSLGGALAQQLFVEFQNQQSVKLKRAVTFNSAGVRYQQDPTYAHLPIVNYIIEKDIVGNATGFHYGQVIYCDVKTVKHRLDPLKLFTHTLDQFAFTLDGEVQARSIEQVN